MKKIDKSTLSVIVLMGVVAIVSLFCEPSGLGGVKQAIAPFIMPLIGGLFSLGSSIASAAIGNKAAKQQAQAYDAAWNNYEDWYQDQMNANILDRADTQAMLKRYREWQEENAKKYQTNAIKGGASEEAKIAYAQEANKGYADAISQIAAQGQKYKDQLSQQYANAKLDFDTNRANMAAQSTQNAVNTITGAGGTIADILGSIDWGK